MTDIYVGGSSIYTTIQEGIQAAALAQASTVIVNPGQYAENDVLTAADSGLTITTANGGVTLTGSITATDASGITLSGLDFQGNGANTAIQAIGGSSLTVSGNQFTGFAEDVVLNGATGSTITGNTMLDTSGSAVEAYNGAAGATISNNIINGDHAAETQGAIWLHGANGSTISHNQISNTDGAAISLTDFSAPGTTTTQNNNVTITANALDTVDTMGQDSGAIYILGRSQNPDSGDVVSQNAITNAGSVGSHAVGIYLDDNASGVTVTGNIVQATPSLSDPWEIHGGSNDTLSGNIFDLGTGHTDFGLFQADEADQQPQGSFSQLQNDAVTGNIFTTESASPHDPGFADLSDGIGDPMISGNDFWAFSGAPLNVAGAGATGDAAANYNPPAPTAAQTLDDYAGWSGAGIGFTAIDTADIGPVAATPACYCRGTLITTTAGDIAIEHLAIGDRLVTLNGAARPIQWIGWRSYQGRFLAANPHLAPVLIQAGALGAGLPRRDLRVSPKHALFLDGVLIPAEHLVNHVTIRRDHGCRAVEYFHLELASHDVIWAEAAASETYLDDGSRAVFHNAASYQRPQPGPDTPGQFAWPRAEHGYALDAARRRIDGLVPLRRSAAA